MSRRQSRFSRAATHLEAALFGNGWPVALVRAFGIRPAVRTVRHSVAVAGWSSRTPLRMAFASDFHAGPTTDPEVLRAGCAALSAAAPDVLLLGGDFVNLMAADIDWLAPELGKIPAPFGRFAVLGNHDLWSNGQHIVERLEAAGIQVLVNRNVRLASPHDDVWICGLDDHSMGDPDARAAVRGAGGLRIVLMHAPSGLLDLGNERFDLALCGHTHGGQIALPGGIPILVPDGRLSRRYARGRFPIGEQGTLVVSVGLGCGVFPLRLFAPPEIIVCELKPIPKELTTKQSRRHFDDAAMAGEAHA
jgi:uncharacterized protein